MAKIPIANKPRVQQHVDNAVHATGAPGLGWRVDNSIGEFGNALSKGLGDVVKSFVDMDRALQETEDKNQLNELSLLETEQTGNAQQYFTQNPTEHGKFGEYLTTLESDADERRKAIYDKMSPRAKEQASYYVRQNQLQRQQHMGKVQYQAHVTSQLQTMENQLTQAAKLGNWELAEQIINSNSESSGKFPPLLSPELKEKYQAHYLQQKDFYGVREQIEQGLRVPAVTPGIKDYNATDVEPLNKNLKKQYKSELGSVTDPEQVLGLKNTGIWAILNKPTREDQSTKNKEPALKESKSTADLLKETNKDGVYVNYPNLSQQQRQQLIRYAEQTQSQIEIDQTQQFIAKMNEGEVPSFEVLEKQYNAGQISLKQLNHYNKMTGDYHSRKQRAEQTNHKGMESYHADLTSLAIWEHTFSADPGEAATEYSEVYQAIMSRFGVDNPATALKLIKELDKQRESQRPGANTGGKVNVNDIYAYKYGQQMLKNTTPMEYTSKDPSAWLFKTRHGLEVIMPNYAMAQVALRKFVELKPDATTNEIDDFLSSHLSLINKTNIDDLQKLHNGLNVENVMRDSRLLRLKPGEYVRMDKGHGKEVIFNKNGVAVDWLENRK